jgi:zinc transport system permease protein
VALGLLGYAILGNIRKADDVNQWVVVAVMIATGVLTGVCMEYVRERTGLTNDTVIGVFFAAAIGFAALLIPALRREVRIDAEAFLFGSVVFISPADLLLLLILAPVTACFVAIFYNTLSFSSFSPQLARSRGLWTRLAGYLFIGLLAVVVNASIKAVGALLINALLVVPAAGAANVARNLRQMFWITLAASVGAGILGFMMSLREVTLNGKNLPLNSSGAIVLSSVAWFFLTIPVAALRQRMAQAAGNHRHSGDMADPTCCAPPPPQD